MAIPEVQLETWANLGATQTSKDTYATIKKVLDDTTAPYANQRPKSFLQGSYGNDTNVYGVDSDVDIVLQCNSVFYYDITPMTEAEQTSFKKVHGDAAYKFADFKKDICEWLSKKYSNDMVPGEKAIRITGNNSRRDADVLPCVQFRRYLKFNGVNDQTHVDGVCFFTPDGKQIINYPKMHSENMTKKHQATSEWLKPIVRILKNMRNRMVADGTLEKGIAPSYYLEGLLYNVPNDKFGMSYDDTFVNAISWIMKADRSTFVCANEQYYLLRKDSPVTWRTEKCETFLNATLKLWKEWKA